MQAHRHWSCQVAPRAQWLKQGLPRCKFKAPPAQSSVVRQVRHSRRRNNRHNSTQMLLSSLISLSLFQLRLQSKFALMKKQMHVVSRVCVWVWSAYCTIHPHIKRKPHTYVIRQTSHKTQSFPLQHKCFLVTLWTASSALLEFRK